MSRFCLTLCALFLATPVLADGGRIKEVTVFADRAKVMREQNTEVQKGPGVVTFTDLPANLMPQSLRVEGESPRAVVRLGAITHEVVVSSKLTSAQEQALVDAIEAMEDQMRVLEAQKSAITARMTFVESLGKQAALRQNEEIAEMRLAPEQWAAAATVIQQDIEAALRADVAVDTRVRTLTRDIERASTALDQVRTDQKQTYTVTIPVEATGPTPLTLRLSYQVSGASWSPIYDARLSTHDGSLNMTQYGNVSQRTGEDWSGVALTLSTARPHEGASLPDLTPWWIGFLSVQADVYAVTFSAAGSSTNAAPVPASMMKSLPQKEEQESLVPESAPAEFAQAIIEGGGFVAATYKIPGPASVPSGGKEVKVMVGDFSMTSKIEVHVKPQISANAFLAARATLGGDSPILPGQVKLFRDEAYIGEGYLKMLRPGDEEVLFFGIDDKVSVERETLADLRKDAGVIVRENTLERSFMTEVKNLHKDPITLVVKETVPASREDRLRVEILPEGTRPGYEKDYADITGLLHWRFDMEPGATERVGLAWRITWPKDQEIDGL